MVSISFYHGSSQKSDRANILLPFGLVDQSSFVEEERVMSHKEAGGYLNLSPRSLFFRPLEEEKPWERDCW